MKITDSVERIDGTMANTYVIRHEGKTVLVDAGMKSSAKKIIGFLRNTLKDLMPFSLPIIIPTT